jgi:hypothetical protein
MFLGQGRFQYQSFDFVIGDDKFDVCDLSNQRVCFAVKWPGLKV